MTNVVVLMGKLARPPETRERLAWALTTLTRTRRPATTRNIPL